MGFRTHPTTFHAGNKEYNLGLFDLSADAALAYDAAHRLVREVAKHPGREKEALLEIEKKKDALPDWLDCEDENGNMSNTFSGRRESDDSERLNFMRPSDFKKAREREIRDRGLLNAADVDKDSKEEGEKDPADSKNDSAKKGSFGTTYPTLSELKTIIRKEAMRIAKVVIASSEGGTGNHKKKRGKSKEEPQAVDDSRSMSEKKSAKKRRVTQEEGNDDGVAAKEMMPPLPALPPVDDASFGVVKSKSSTNNKATKKSSGRSNQSKDSTLLASSKATSESLSNETPSKQSSPASKAAGAAPVAEPASTAHPKIDYDATGLGKPVPNPPRTKSKKKNHPFGPPPVVSNF